MRVTRLAPSPTGALHLGNARTFLINWLMARQAGWRVLLRIEDLRWLGLDWDDGPVYQSTRAEVYRAAVGRLLAEGKTYPCVCTRREVELAASAPHAEDGASVYPGTCRGKFSSMREAEAASGR